MKKTVSLDFMLAAIRFKEKDWPMQLQKKYLQYKTEVRTGLPFQKKKRINDNLIDKDFFNDIYEEIW